MLNQRADESRDLDSPAAATFCSPCHRSRVGEWFGRWRRPIRDWLRNTGSVSSADIDDLSQEVFLRLLRYSDEAVVENPQAYLFRIAANVANEWYVRGRRLRSNGDELEQVPIEPDAEPENVLAQVRRDKFIRAAVEQLPPRQREVLLLHVEDGLTYKQIARERGLTYRMVLRDLTRAYGALRAQLRREDL